MITNLTFSVVINNYNYASFLRESIDSALAQRWPSVQVVVVDDGSTDGSRAIIESYGAKIVSIFSDNQGQGSAYNLGYMASHGDLVCFLDADDVLLPDACRIVAKSYFRGHSKVQGKLRMVYGERGDAGYKLGMLIPFNRTLDVDIYGSALKFYYYSSPPGSGNFYSRDFLKIVMPMPVSRWRISADAYLIGRAPFHGRVCALETCLGYYRIHQTSASAGASNFSSWGEIRSYANKEYKKELKRKSQVLEYYRRLFGHVGESVMDTPSLIKFRILLRRGETRFRFRRAFTVSIIRRAVRASIYWRPYTTLKKIGFLAWVVSMLFLPRYLAFRLARKTVYPYSRGF